MKRTIFLTALMAICLMTNISCSSDVTNEVTDIQREVEESNSMEMEKLCTELQKYNNNTFGEISVNSIQSKNNANSPRYKNGSFKKFWKRFWKVVVADIVGAIKGATVEKGKTLNMLANATSSSATALEACLEKQNTTSDKPTIDNSSSTTTTQSSTTNKDTVTLKLNTNTSNLILNTRKNTLLNSPIDSLGYFHNLAIIEFNKDHSNWLTLSTADLTKEIGYAIAKVTGWCTTEQWTEYINQNRTIIEMNRYLYQLVSDEDTDVKSMCQQLRSKYPECKNQIDFVYEAIKGFVACDADDFESSDYAEEILSLIENANLSNGLTTQLRSGIVIANASYKLWSTAVVE